jgi:hypothetical protein
MEVAVITISSILLEGSYCAGEVLVPLAYVHHGDMRLNSKPRILRAPVELAAKQGEAPKN